MLSMFANDRFEIEVRQDVAIEYDRRFANEILRKLVSARRAHRLRLNGVSQIHAVISAVAEQLFDLVWLIRKRERDVGNARASQRVDLIKEKRPIADWHNRFRRIDGQGPQPRALSAGKY